MMIQSGLYRNIQQWLIPRIKYQRTLLNTYVEDKINTLLTGDPDTAQVYSEGCDSHCFRTYYYWKDQMPDIQQANEDEQCFKLTLEDGSELTVKASDTLIYQGKETTAQELLQNML